MRRSVLPTALLAMYFIVAPAFCFGQQLATPTPSADPNDQFATIAGTVAGSVTNKDDLPAAGSLVVLVPDAGSHQKPEQYKTANTDQYGHFEVRGIPPGHYKAFAWERVNEESYGDPDFLRPVENKSESFDVGANEQKSVQLKLIPASDSAN